METRDSEDQEGVLPGAAGDGVVLNDGDAAGGEAVAGEVFVDGLNVAAGKDLGDGEAETLHGDSKPRQGVEEPRGGDGEAETLLCDSKPRQGVVKPHGGDGEAEKLLGDSKPRQVIDVSLLLFVLDYVRRFGGAGARPMRRTTLARLTLRCMMPCSLSMIKSVAPWTQVPFARMTSSKAWLNWRTFGIA